MGVTIRRKDTGEVFHLPTDFSLEVNNTSPIFNDIGSKSVPATFPKDDNGHNSAMLGYAHRPDIDTKPTNEIVVIVSEGSYAREGMLYLNEARNTDKEYSVTIAFNEGIMYNKMKAMKLPNLPNLPTDERSYDEMLAYANRLLHIDDLDEKLTIFPVTLKEQGRIGERIFYPYLNAVGADKNLVIKPTVEHLEGSEPITIEVPLGYGVTPFVRLWYVLERIFTHFGYTINENPFRTEFQLRRLVLLNNTIDTIIESQIKYAQLMPNCTIFELFTALFVRFGAKIFVDGNTNTVDIVLLRDILASSADTQIPIASEPDLQYTEPKQLKLSAGKGLDRSNTEEDTYEEFLARYNNTIDSDRFVTYRTGMSYNLLHGTIYQTTVGQEESRFVSSFHFNWNKQTDGIDTEEHTSVDEGLSMFFAHGKELYYGIDYALRNSRMELNQDIRDIDVENKLAFAFDMGEGYTARTNEYWGYKFGTILPYLPETDNDNKPIYFVDKEGNKMKYALTFIGDDGCFVHFHKQYDAMLRHSNYVVKTKADLPKFKLSSIRYQQPYNIHGQPMLLDKLDYILGGFNHKELTARTTRLYRPYDLEAEHGLPRPSRIRYQWKQQDNAQKKIEERALDREIYYTTNRPPGVPAVFYELISLETNIKGYPNPPAVKNLWYLPPTQRQHDQQVTIGETKHKATVDFIAHFKYWNGSEIAKGAYTDPGNKSVDYIAYFISVKV